MINSWSNGRSSSTCPNVAVTQVRKKNGLISTKNDYDHDIEDEFDNNYEHRKDKDETVAARSFQDLFWVILK